MSPIFSYKDHLNFRIKTVSESFDLDSVIANQPYTLTFTTYYDDIAPYDVNIVDKDKRILFIRDNSVSLEMLGYAIRKSVYYLLLSY